MIDIENQIFGKISTALRAEFDPIFVSGELVKAPATFPAVYIEEKVNSAYQRTQDSGSLENHVSLMYEINVYSNKQVGKKSECKAIFAVIDNEFQKMGFTRIMKEPVANLEDGTIYRMIGRYTAVVSVGGIIFRR
jgi:predicted ATPase